MNFDPIHQPRETFNDEIIAEKEKAAAGSSMMVTIVGLIVAVAIIAIVIAWSPWAGGSGGGGVTPGQGGQDQPLPGQRLPDQQRPGQPGILPTSAPQTSPR